MRKGNERGRRAPGWGALLVFALVGCGQRELPTQAADAWTAPGVDAAAGRDALVDARPDAGDGGTSLAADVEDRVAKAHERFGSAARVRVVGGIFVLVEVGTSSPLFDKAAALMEKALPPLYDGRFSKRPSHGVTALFFPDGAAYARYVHERHPDAGAVLGLYQGEGRELAVDVSLGEDYLPTFTHEMVHPLMNDDFPDAPKWFKEGVASLFEAPVFGPDGGIHGSPRNWRYDDYLQPAFASATERKLLRVDALFGMRTLEFSGGKDGTAGAAKREIESVHYALARSVCAWMDAKGTLWGFYRAWRDGYAGDRKGVKAFQRVMGATPGEMQGAWVAWAR